MMMMMTTLSYPMKKQQMETLMKQNRGKDVNRYPLCDVEYSRGQEHSDQALVECHWSLIVSI